MMEITKIHRTTDPIPGSSTCAAVHHGAESTTEKTIVIVAQVRGEDIIVTTDLWNLISELGRGKPMYEEEAAKGKGEEA
jgi:hypothetical protein